MNRKSATFLLAGLVALLGGCAGGAPRAEVQSAPSPSAAAVPERAGTPEVRTPRFYQDALARGTRSESGAPGPAYWQNRVSYRIRAELDPENALLRGTEEIVFRNESPASLPSLVIELSQNIFAPGVPRNRFVPITGGITLERVSAQGQELQQRTANQIPIGGDIPVAPSGYAVQGTLGRIRLPAPLLSGDSVVVEIDWHYTIPPAPNFRTAWEDALGARAFHVAQWYPRIAVFDDLHGWNLSPYLGDGEFYQEYGDFEVAITVPTGFLIGATGELVNPEEVLTAEASSRLLTALDADTTTRIVTAADRSAENVTQSSPGGQLTWHFRAADVRDFAFSTSSGYVWDATRLRTRDGRSIPVHALYRPGAPNWEDAARFGQHATRFFDDFLIPYPYPQISIVEGPIGGMEYPMVVFIGRPPSAESLYDVIAHEIAHQWFPMVVGQNEAAYAWMDEGIATYVENLGAADFFGNPDPFAGDLASYRNIAGSEYEVPLMRHTDLVSPYGSRGVAAYSKPALLLRTLRGLMGEEQFRSALDLYAREWYLKHPTPWDFFSTFERLTGSDLGWLFQPWWFETGVLDLAIESVRLNESGETVLTLRNLGTITAPTPVLAVTSTGTRLERWVPLEEWLASIDGTVSLTLTSADPIVRIMLDPEQVFPDIDPENNSWRAP